MMSTKREQKNDKVMALSSFLIYSLFAWMSFIGSVQSKQPKLTPFGEKTKKELPKKTYDKIYSFDIIKDGDLEKGVKDGTKRFYDILGIPFDESLVKKIDEDNDDLGKNNITPELLFHAQTYAFYHFLKEEKILNGDNIDDLVKRYVNELEKAAKNAKKNDIVSTLVVSASAAANFLKDEGLTSKKDAEKFSKYYLQELKKYKKSDKSG